MVDNSSSLDFSQTNPVPNREYFLYTENDLFDLPKTLERIKKPDTCTDEFLKLVGVSTYWYKSFPKPKLSEL